MMSNPSDAGYSIYELLHTLIERSAWPTETEKHTAHASVERMEAVSLFGNMAKIIECKHDDVSISYRGTSRCRQCGRIM